MRIGIDVGGTHADGVLLEKGVVKKKKKVRVDDDRLSDSLLNLLKYLLPEEPDKLERIHLSTTLCTNAVVNNQLDQVGMVIQSGPGLNPAFLSCGPHSAYLSGAIDHRGEEVRPLSESEVDEAIVKLKKEGISSVGIVTKFSHRNNKHELQIYERLKGKFDYFSLGHQLSGVPNFPRRVYTTWLNSALKSVFNHFYSAMKEGLDDLGINCPVYMLKADGGTLPFNMCGEQPCQSVHSGPSASVLGAVALVSEMDQDTVLLDVGGTTTDISLFADGLPLLEPYGITIGGRPTLIRALHTKSVGLGGDSKVSFENGNFCIGGKTDISSASMNDRMPTPTDAMIVLDASITGKLKEEAAAALKKLKTDTSSLEETAKELLNGFALSIRKVVEEMVEETYSRPVYTVSALLDRKRVVPTRVVLIGGPAASLKTVIEKQLGIPCHVPTHYEVANAIGAAKARLTFQISLYADTSRDKLIIPELSVTERTGGFFSMVDAEERVTTAAKVIAERMGFKEFPKLDFIERLEMNCVRGFSTTGKIITLKAQVRPGLEYDEVKA